MFTLFNPPYKKLREPIALPMFEYYIRQTNIECDKVLSYFEQNAKYGKSTDNWLRLLITIEKYIDLEPKNLVAVIRNDTPRLNNMFGFVSPTNTGKIQIPGAMYNRNIHDLFMTVEYPFDPNVVAKQYKTVCPVRVLSHDLSDFSYGVCDGEYNTPVKGLAIFSVDLAMLAIQFQQWSKHERVIDKTGASRQITEFIAKYIWTSTLYTSMDNVLFNRLINKLDGVESERQNNQHSFYLADFGTQFDNVFGQLIDTFKKRPTGWLDRLQAVPSLKRSNFYESMLFPDTAPTRQIRWVMVLSKLKMVEFLLKTDEFAQNEALNIGDRNVIQRELRILLNDRSFETTVPESYMNRIHTIYNKVNKE